MDEAIPNPALLVRVTGAICAFPLAEVIETMRPLPVEPLENQCDLIQGVARIRGNAVPVVDLTALFHDDPICDLPTRFVTLRVGLRCVALAVQSVIGVVDLSHQIFGDLPPLLKNVRTELIQSLGTLDSEFLVTLDAARLVPDSVWQELAQTRSTQ
jgi:purine-binding chemotaxis protein CheW